MYLIVYELAELSMWVLGVIAGLTCGHMVFR
jgi:hypothetical protein